MTERQGEEREEFGQALPGDAQSSRPPVDPEMIRGEEEGHADDEAEPEEPGDGTRGGTEQYGGDQDAEPAATEDELGDERPPAEG